MIHPFIENSGMKLILIVGIGSFLGGILRYVLFQTIPTKINTSFPFGTLSVNLIGCFVIGLILSFSDRGHMSSDWKLFLATGICGGFTTYSAFSGETFTLLRDGNISSAGIYVITSLVLGVLLTYVGYVIGRLF